MEIQLIKEYPHEDVLFSMAKGDGCWFAAGVDRSIYQFGFGEISLKRSKAGLRMPVLSRDCPTRIVWFLLAMIE